MNVDSAGITDFHAHAFPDELAPRAMQTLGAAAPHEARAHLDGTVADLLRSMDRAGVRRSVLCNVATAPWQTGPILAWALRVRSGRIVPFGSVHPDGPDAPGDAARIAAAGLAGIKLHPQYQNFAFDEPRMKPLYEAIAESGLILLVHAGQDMAYPPDDERAAPRRLLKVHEAFPTIPLVAAHMGGWQRWAEAARTLAGTGVYLETSYSLDRANPDELARLLELHPIERILFGTDSPWQDQGRMIELVRRTWPSPADQEAVLAGNAQRLLARAAGRGGC